ncbi:MAG TPA: hypothetical protein GXZ87_07640 [Bacteroidales bacterium]|nr:hypothetical protein [Bacteroidales bacterium]
MSKPTTFILSDESLNTYGFRLLTSGADLEQFKRNPVMFYNHNDMDMPIGRWENIRIENGQILADAVFDKEDNFAGKIAGKVERGFLRAASVGLRVIETSDDPKYLLQGQKLPTATRWTLREASVVTIGSNHNALRLYDANDKLLTDEQILKLFDNMGASEPPQNQSKKMNNEILTLLDLAEGSTEAQVLSAIQKLKDENKQLRDAASEREKADKEARKLEAEKLVDEAIKDGRLNADGKQDMLSLFDANFETAKKTLAAIPVRKSVKEQIETQNQPKELDELAKLSWDELDKAGKLAELKENHHDIYVEKFEAKFGKKPEK